MRHWMGYPFLRITFVFICGVVVCAIVPAHISPIWTIGLFLIYVFIFIYNTKLCSTTIGALMIWGMVFLLGFSHRYAITPAQRPDHFLHAAEFTHYQAKIVGYQEENERYFKTEARVLAVRKSTWERAEGKILLYLQKSEFSKSFSHGTVVMVKGAPQSVPPPRNPKAFDYQSYLSHRGIYGIAFPKPVQVHLMDSGARHPFRIAQEVRNWCAHRLSRYVAGSNELAIAQALVLGITDYIDGGLMQAYASSGTIHVLAVSGLHVGILYLVLLVLLKPVKRFDRSRWIETSTCMVVLWLYAFVAGLSPSVLRAVTMFSCIALGKVARKQNNILNTLAISACILVLYDPLIIHAVGFQLSYAAVLGIVLFVPLQEDAIQTTSWIMDRIWSATSVTIAAQLLTAPLAMLYFHQFPVYFLFSNLLVLPLSFIALIAGLALVVLSGIPFMGNALGALLALVLSVMNVIVRFFDTLPQSFFHGVQISVWQCVLATAAAFLLYHAFKRRRKYLLYGSLLLLFAIGVLQWYHHLAVFKQEEVVIYHSPNGFAIDYFRDGNVYSWANGKLDSGYYAMPYRIFKKARYIGKLPVRNMSDWGQLTCAGGEKVLRLTRSPVSGGHIKVDVLIIGNNCIRDFSRLNRHVSATKIIFDCTNTPAYCLRWKHLPNAYSIPRRGAYMENR